MGNSVRCHGESSAAGFLLQSLKFEAPGTDSTFNCAASLVSGEHYAFQEDVVNRVSARDLTNTTYNNCCTSHALSAG